MPSIVCPGQHAYGPLHLLTKDMFRTSGARTAVHTDAHSTALLGVQAVPYDFSLAAVRQYIWKRSDDPVLQYGRQNSNKPAPMPIIRQAS